MSDTPNQPTNKEDASQGNENAISHVAYAAGYEDGKIFERTKLERELAAMTAERDELHQRLITVGSICASGSDRPPGKAYSFEEWAEMLLAERDRMRPVVAAAREFKNLNDINSGNALILAVLTYEALQAQEPHHGHD